MDLNKDKAVSIINSTFNDSSINFGIITNEMSHLIDKLMEALDENKRVYIALLNEKQVRIAFLEKILADNV